MVADVEARGLGFMRDVTGYERSTIDALGQGLETDGFENLDKKLMLMRLPEAPEVTRAGKEIGELDGAWNLTWRTKELARGDRARGPQATPTDSWTGLENMAKT
mmetsp:Transcript_8440/g.17144  ORF Transcript_8440/g.17144 Transcript_8440/m.17144 type:complete len:104 (-) Transcript_8440:630-941(-)